MTTCRKALYALACAPMLCLAVPAHAQQAAPEPKGLTIIKSKCFQCHTDSMWRDQRQDARAWEANLYRMVGRGALWTTDEIKEMAAYLGTEYGPNTKPAWEQKK